MGQDTIDRPYIVMHFERVGDVERWWMSCMLCGYGSAHVTQDQLGDLQAWVEGHVCVVKP